ncbi:type IV pilus biogenesis protein PilP [Salmonella enterica subsp. enterica serovar Worthington]|nr:type IV pilus biogenesis protein PilP [Salmonella enterica subsp. enterica serovar Worthington]
MANTNANKYLGAGLGLLLLSFCFMAGAEDLTGTARDLDTLQKQRVLYEAQAAVKKHRQRLKAWGSISTGTLSSSTGEAGSGMRNTVSATPDITPQLVKINGRNAVISMPGGKTITVNSDRCYGGRWQVVSVSLNGVKVRNISTRREEILN